MATTLDSLPESDRTTVPVSSNAIAQDDTNGTYTVCITLDADNQYSTGELGEPLEPAADLKDALTIAMELLRTRGGADERSAEDEFSRGFESRTRMGKRPMERY